MALKQDKPVIRDCAHIARVLEIDANAPSHLRRSAGTIDETRWFVLHTKPRQEKALAAMLDSREIATFLPLQRTVRYYGHRKRVVHQPLFPGYVFLQSCIEATWEALNTGRVVNLIHAADQELLGHEIEQLRLALACGATLAPHARLVRGCHVRVTAGPFAGLEGLVEQRIRPDRLVLQIDTLGRAACLEIDADLLERVD